VAIGERIGGAGRLARLGAGGARSEPESVSDGHDAVREKEGRSREADAHEVSGSSP